MAAEKRTSDLTKKDGQIAPTNKVNDNKKPKGVSEVDQQPKLLTPTTVEQSAVQSSKSLKDEISKHLFNSEPTKSPIRNHLIRPSLSSTKKPRIPITFDKEIESTVEESRKPKITDSKVEKKLINTTTPPSETKSATLCVTKADNPKVESKMKETPNNKVKLNNSSSQPSRKRAPIVISFDEKKEETKKIEKPNLLSESSKNKPSAGRPIQSRDETVITLNTATKLTVSQVNVDHKRLQDVPLSTGKKIRTKPETVITLNNTEKNTVSRIDVENKRIPVVKPFTVIKDCSVVLNKLKDQAPFGSFREFANNTTEPGSTYSQLPKDSALNLTEISTPPFTQNIPKPKPMLPVHSAQSSTEISTPPFTQNIPKPKPMLPVDSAQSSTEISTLPSTQNIPKPKPKLPVDSAQSSTKISTLPSTQNIPKPKPMLPVDSALISTELSTSSTPSIPKPKLSRDMILKRKLLKTKVKDLDVRNIQIVVSGDHKMFQSKTDENKNNETVVAKPPHDSKIQRTVPKSIPNFISTIPKSNVTNVPQQNSTINKSITYSIPNLNHTVQNITINNIPKSTTPSFKKPVANSIPSPSNEPFAKPTPVMIPTRQPIVYEPKEQPIGEDDSNSVFSICVNPSLVDDIDKHLRGDRFYTYRNEKNSSDEEEEEEPLEVRRKVQNRLTERQQVRMVQEPENRLADRQQINSRREPLNRPTERQQIRILQEPENRLADRQQINSGRGPLNRPTERQQIRILQEPENRLADQQQITSRREPLNRLADRQEQWTMEPRVEGYPVRPISPEGEPPGFAPSFIQNDYSVQNWLNRCTTNSTFDRNGDSRIRESCIKGICLQHLQKSVDQDIEHDCTGMHRMPDKRLLEKLIAEDQTLVDRIINEDFTNPQETFIRMLLEILVRNDDRSSVEKLGLALKSINNPAISAPLWKHFVVIWFTSLKESVRVRNQSFSEMLGRVFPEIPFEDQHTQTVQIILQCIADFMVEVPNKVQCLFCVEFLVRSIFPKESYPDSFKLACFDQVNSKENDDFRKKFGFRALRTLVNTSNIPDIKRLYMKSPTVVEEFLKVQPSCQTLLDVIKQPHEAIDSLPKPRPVKTFNADLLVRQTKVDPEKASKWLSQFEQNNLPLKRIFESYEKAGRQIYQTLISQANDLLRNTLAPVTFKFLGLEASEGNWASSFSLYKCFFDFDPNRIEDLDERSFPTSKALLVINVCLEHQELREALDLFMKFNFTNKEHTSWALPSCLEDRENWEELCLKVAKTLEHSALSTTLLYSCYLDLSVSQNSFSEPVDLERGMCSLIEQLVGEGMMNLAVQFTNKVYNLSMLDNFVYLRDSYISRLLIIGLVQSDQESSAFFPIVRKASELINDYDESLEFVNEQLWLGTNLEPEEIFAQLVYKFYRIKAQLGQICFHIHFQTAENKRRAKSLPVKDFSLSAAYSRFQRVLEYPRLSRFKSCFIKKTPSTVMMDPITYNSTLA